MDGDKGVIVSVSGVRGVVGQGLTPELVAAFASAFGAYVQGGRVVVSRDSRPSGQVLRHAVLSGLLAAGCAVEDIGIAATPTCGLAIRQTQAKGGIQITASHNPAPWNGLKLFGPEGSVLTASAGQCVRQLFEQGDFRRAAWNELGSWSECSQATEWHCQRVLELIDGQRIRAARLRTFLDANGGAGGPLGRRLLEELHTQPVCVGCQADGQFAHEPEPTAANVAGIAPRVAAAGADVGFVLDPDADRLALIDETGRYIGEEWTLALAVYFRLRQQRGPVVINMSTSRLVEDIAQRQDCPCHRAAVGEANVVEKMRQVHAVIGGEGNGGVIDPRVGGVRDPFIGMGLILNLLAETGRKLSELVAELPAYTIVKDKYALAGVGLAALLTALEQRWPDARGNRLDGLRLDWPERWLHVRGSNTEPILRVIAEAPSAAAAEQLCQEVERIIRAQTSA
ncbi:MAG: phosphoglucosamine mutase [Gemmataceae bacterium]